ARVRALILHLGALCALFLSAHPAAAQFTEDFEGLSAGPSGVFLSGQDCWYLPTAGGRDHKVYTYAGNNLNGNGDVRTNPLGGSKFAAGNSAGSVFGRAQHTGVGFPDVADIQFDLLVAVPTSQTQNLGSLSLADGDNTSRFIYLARWEPTASPSGTYRF